MWLLITRRSYQLKQHHNKSTKGLVFLRVSTFHDRHQHKPYSNTGIFPNTVFGTCRWNSTVWSAAPNTVSSQPCCVSKSSPTTSYLLSQPSNTKESALLSQLIHNTPHDRYLGPREKECGEFSTPHSFRTHQLRTPACSLLESLTPYQLFIGRVVNSR